MAGLSLITLTSGPVEIATKLAIAGPGASSLTISGNNRVEVFGGGRQRHGNAHRVDD